MPFFGDITPALVASSLGYISEAGVTRDDVLALSISALWDMTDSDTMYQDEAKTTLATAVNDPVAVIIDLKNSEELAILTGQTTRRPLRSSAGLVGDGINDILKNATFSGISFTEPYSISIAFKVVATANNRYVFSGSDGGGYYPSLYIDGSSKFRLDPPSPPYDAGVSDTDFHVITVRNSTDGVTRIQFDGVDTGALTDFRVGNFTGLAIFAAYAEAAFSNVEIQKMTLADSFLSDEDVATIEAWMGV